MATLKEIAKKIDVSITTVSRVLNNDASLSVSDEVRKKVISTAAKMDYKTPRHRVRLKSSSALTIAIIHWYNINEEMDDPYYMQIRRGIEQLAIKSNIKTILLYKNNGEFNLDNINDIDGLICVGKFSRDQISSFEAISKNIVFVDSSPNEEVFDSVVIDFDSSVTEVLSLMIEKGYTKIGYIGGVEYINTSVVLGEKREFVFKEFLLQNNLLDKRFIHIGTFSSESGYELMKAALLSENRAEVYFCANDSIALGVLRAIHEEGLKVPEEIGVFGFNNNSTSKYTFPPLSTVHVYTEFMGEQALNSIIEKIDGRVIPLKKTIPTKLILRATLK